METPWQKLHSLVTAAERSPSDDAFSAIEKQVRLLREKSGVSGGSGGGGDHLIVVDSAMKDYISKMLKEYNIATSGSLIIAVNGNQRAVHGLRTLDVSELKRKYSDNIIILRYHLSMSEDFGSYDVFGFEKVVNLWIKPEFGVKQTNYVPELRKDEPFNTYNRNNLAQLKKYIASGSVRACIECSAPAEYAQVKYFCGIGCHTGYHARKSSKKNNKNRKQ